jgi:hypothetical protein
MTFSTGNSRYFTEPARNFPPHLNTGFGRTGFSLSGFDLSSCKIKTRQAEACPTEFQKIKRHGKLGQSTTAKFKNLFGIRPTEKQFKREISTGHAAFE